MCGDSRRERKSAVRTRKKFSSFLKGGQTPARTAAILRRLAAAVASCDFPGVMKVAILGPGLLGGSIALAFHQQQASEVAIWGRRTEAVDEVRRMGFARVASTAVADVVADAATVILAVPIGAMPALAHEIVPHLSPSALVMDVGSVKGPVVAQLEP